MAKLAGLPNSVLKRAEVILSALESSAEANEAEVLANLNTGIASANTSSTASEMINGVSSTSPTSMTSTNLFTTSVLDDLLAVDVMSLTPIEALNVLYKLQEEARKGGGQ